MAKRAGASEHAEPEAGIVKANDPSIGAPANEDITPELKGPAAGPTFGQRAGRFLGFLLRLVLLLIVLVAIGAGLYFGLPLLYRRYVVPVEQNTAQMRQLQSRLAQAEQDLADLRKGMQTLEVAQNEDSQSLSKLDQRLSTLETDIAARTKSLAALEQVQSELQEQNVAISAELERQVDLLKAMELLSRARLFMYQSNFGLARQDVQSGRDLLGMIRPGAPQGLADDLDAVIQRLDMTLSNLPDFPVAASDDLDIAWQVLLSGLPGTQTVVTETPAVTPSVTPESSLTPTPQVTVQPSPTP